MSIFGTPDTPTERADQLSIIGDDLAAIYARLDALRLQADSGTERECVCNAKDLVLRASGMVGLAEKVLR